MPPVILQINVQDTVCYFRPEPIPQFRVICTDRHRFLIALGKKKLDAAADPDPMKIADRTLLRIGVIDYFRILSKDHQPGQHR